MTEKFELSRRKALVGLATIGAAGAGAGMGTSALFSDEESFTENSITAGTTNLIVEAKIAAQTQGLANNGTVKIEASDDDGDGFSEVDGDAEIGLTVSDVKPGDKFVVGFNVIVEDNPMYVGVQPANADDSEGENTEPELSTSADPDTGSDGVGDGNGDDAGDLDNVANIVVGYDSSPNDFTWDESGAVAPPNTELGGSMTLNDFLTGGGFLYRDGDAGSGIPTGHGSAAPTELGGGDNVTHWVCVEVPASVGNEIQGDTVSFDLVWLAEQVRNNPAPGSVGELDGNQNSS